MLKNSLYIFYFIFFTLIISVITCYCNNCLIIVIIDCFTFLIWNYFWFFSPDSETTANLYKPVTAWINEVFDIYVYEEVD